MPKNFILILLISTLDTFAQNKTVVALDYDTSDPIPYIFLFCGDKKLGETDEYGAIEISSLKCEYFTFRYVGFHTIRLSSETLSKIDTLNFFRDYTKLSMKNSKYRPHKKIQNDRISFEKHGFKYIYLYDEKDHSLELRIDNVH